MENIDSISALPVGRYRLRKKPQTDDHCDTHDQSIFQLVPGQGASSVPPTPIEDAGKQVVQESAETSRQTTSVDEGIYEVLRWSFRELRENGILVLSDLDQVRILFSMFYIRLY